MSSPTITRDNPHTANVFTAPNLPITFPTTPRRPPPNSAKKRRQMPDLSRPTATPGHGTKMSMIFRDAANSLQGSGLPMHRVSPNIKKSRLPLSQARSIKFGSTCQDDKIFSSGLKTPSKISQNLGESHDFERASSEISFPWAARVGPLFSTPTHLTKADGAILPTITHQRSVAATGPDDMYIDQALRVSKLSSPSQVEQDGKEPTSSGFATPIALTPSFVENPQEAKYPILGNWRSLQSSSNASDSGSDSHAVHSAYGAASVLPFSHSIAEEAPRSDIDKWLNGIEEAPTSKLSSSPEQSNGRKDSLMTYVLFSRGIASNASSSIRPRILTSKLELDIQSPSEASSDKENISPSTKASPPTRLPARRLQTRNLSRFHQNNTQTTLQDTKTLHFAHSLAPQDHLRIAPKRKRACVDGVASSRAEAKMPTHRDFTIPKAQVAEALAQLSPDVERHRKGRGPRRERCMSYWDQDILPPGLQCVPMDVDSTSATMGKEQVLGESKETVELAKKKLFTKEAGFARFQLDA